MIIEHHYAHGAANTAVFRHGLYHRDRGMVGAALWMPPTKVAAQSVHPHWRGVLCLSRLVVIPGEPTNAASYLMGRSMRIIRQDGRWHDLVTYADERQGHTGTIYQATNWTYLGSRQGDPIYLDQEGRQVARKATKSRTHTRMLDLGYQCVGRSIKHKYVKKIRDLWEGEEV
jgi:hypothetical protein